MSLSTSETLLGCDDNVRRGNNEEGGEREADDGREGFL